MLSKISLRTFSSTVQGPLHGVRVLDLSRILAGPACTMALGDYGAEVLKIENPRNGDDTRTWPPFFKPPDMSYYFIAVNRNKKSVCVNFKQQQGRQLIVELAKQCDVFFENYVPGVLRKYGLDYDSLKAVAPGLIYCSLTGFGSSGPSMRKQGVDLIAASVGGHLHVTGEPNGNPCRSGVSAIDLMTGFRAQAAITAALYDRVRTGRGRHIEVDLYSTALMALKNHAVNYLNLKIEPQRWGTAHSTVVPYESFQSKDGYFTTGAVSDEQFVKLSQLLKQPQLAQDERFRTAASRVENRKELVVILKPIFAAQTTKEWCDIFEGSGLPFGQLNTVGQAFEDAHTKAIGLVTEMEYPNFGSVKIVGPAITFSDYEIQLKAAPSLGQHTDEVLKSLLNLSTAEIADLKKLKTIR